MTSEIEEKLDDRLKALSGIGKPIGIFDYGANSRILASKILCAQALELKTSKKIRIILFFTNKPLRTRYSTANPRKIESLFQTFSSLEGLDKYKGRSLQLLTLSDNNPKVRQEPLSVDASLVLHVMNLPSSF